jgi:preprotein translocase subunit SecY
MFGTDLNTEYAVAADLLGLDTQQPRDQMIYQGLQKTLVVVMVCLTGLPMVFLGGFLPADPALANSLGVGTFGMGHHQIIQRPVSEKFFQRL